MLVVGSGAIGIEFASFYRTLGAEVTVVEVMDRVMPVEDEEISNLAAKAFAKQGMKIVTRDRERTQEGQRQGHGDPEGRRQDTEMTVDRVILAVGIVGNVENIGLEETGVKVEKTHIVVDAMARRARRGLGDRRPGWPAVACAQGDPRRRHGRREDRRRERRPSARTRKCRAAPIAAAGGERRPNRESRQGKRQEVKVGKFPFIGNGKAIALGEAEGLVKTVFDAETGELLGAHMVGAEVTEMIQG